MAAFSLYTKKWYIEGFKALHINILLTISDLPLEQTDGLVPWSYALKSV